MSQAILSAEFASAGLTEVVPIELGGTNATTAVNARSNLGAAPISSPAFTGTPTAPTAAATVNNTQIATTAFAVARANARQEQSTTTMNGQVLIGGATAGTFGVSRGIDTTPTVNSSNLITSGGAFEFVSTFGPAITIDSTVGNLQATINALSKLINRNVTINVSSGTSTGGIVISNFYGSGTLVINGAATITNTHSVNRIQVLNCSCTVNILGFNCTITNGDCINITNSLYVFIRHMRLVQVDRVNGRGAVVSSSKVRVRNSQINDKASAFLAYENSYVVTSDISGSGSSVIFWANRGIILNGGSTITGTTRISQISGGRVFE